jgi:hypothetical protein
MENEERLQILNMIANNKVTASDGVQLLEALGEVNPIKPLAVKSHSEGGWLKIIITDLVTGNIKTTVNIPLRLVEWGFGISSRYTDELRNVDMTELYALLDSDLHGKILEVIDEEDGEKVEIFVE